MLLAVGQTRRWLDRLLTAGPATPVVLEQPLSSFPMQLGEWVGIDIPVDERVLKVAGNDDHISRKYAERGSKHVIDLYVAYTARPVNMLGHRPDVCYPAHGWTHVSTAEQQMELRENRELDYLIHEFAREDPLPERLLVLNYYVHQGRHTTQWTDFWGPKWRRPNVSRDPTYYVAQVQIAAGPVTQATLGRASDAVTRFAREAAVGIDALLPLTEVAEARSVASRALEDAAP